MGMKNITKEVRKLYPQCMIALRPFKPNEEGFIEPQAVQNDPYSRPLTLEEISAITSDKFKNYILSGENT